jgi:predicted  nucleic acid-binding Zn-ribbon protein
MNPVWFEPCDGCHTAYPADTLTAVINEDACAELRCPACVERLREELQDLGLSA